VYANIIPIREMVEINFKLRTISKISVWNKLQFEDSVTVNDSEHTAV
jgi:hypothetical protein